MKQPLFATLCLLAVAGPARAGIEVAIISPDGTQASFGEFEISAKVTATEPVRAVDFYVDGRLAGTATEAPYKLKVDVGWENQEHHYRVVATDASGLSAEARLATPAIKVEMDIKVQLKQLYVTVTDGGRRALGLERGDFSIQDDGVSQEMVTFERGEVPITAVVLLDSSQSMEGARMQHAQEGAKVFIEGLRDLDQGMLMTFSDRLLVSTPFVSEGSELKRALSGLAPEGGTAVNDVLYLALERLEAQPGRPVVVLLSDGIDVHSAVSMREVVWKAGRSQALIYWLRLMGEGKQGGDTISTAWRSGAETKTELEQLEEAVVQSGGEIIPIVKPEELKGAFAGILAELREQYVLGYYPSNAAGDGRWHKVKVALKEGGYRVRHRGGYADL